MTKALERFIRYAKVFTQSDPDSETYPSTQCQFDLANLLVLELKELGIKDAVVDQFGYVTGTVISNVEKVVPVIGFLAHMDTSPSSPGENVNPQIVKNYNGGDIVLNKEASLILSPTEFPKLKDYIGQDIVTTDGTTLLGADNKAGIAAIMSAVEYIFHHPEVQHGTVKIGFTPDEEVGRGVNYFDVKRFGADYAYTMDGGEIGEYEYENFNAASAKVIIHGKQVHPGTAKNVMKNSILIGMELINMLPAAERPEYTEKREGFFHVDNFSASVENAEMLIIIRDHEKSKFELKKQIVIQAADYLNTKYGEGTITVDLRDSYYNMLEKIIPVGEINDIALQAIQAVGVQPKINAVRGGTDGARLSYMGLPCPNIFSGGLNYHSRYEFLPVQSLEKATEVILKIIELFVQK